MRTPGTPPIRIRLTQRCLTVLVRRRGISITLHRLVRVALRLHKLFLTVLALLQVTFILRPKLAHAAIKFLHMPVAAPQRATSIPLAQHAHVVQCNLQRIVQAQPRDTFIPRHLLARVALHSPQLARTVMVLARV